MSEQEINPTSSTEQAASAKESDKEYAPKSRPARSSNAQFKFVFMILLIAAVAIIVIATVVKIALTNQALSSQAKYEQICVLLRGELAISKTYDGRMLDCVSGMSLLTTPDGMTLCNKDDECEGACVGDFTAAVDYQGACSEGIRLLPRFE